MVMPRRGKYIGLLTAALLCAPLLSSCSKESVAPLRIASSPWPGYEPMYLSRELGYQSPQQVNVFELPSADISLEAFRNRTADMATLTLDETLELLASGVKLRILFVMDASKGADAVMATPKIKTLADLKGRRIAIENIPLGGYMLTRTLNAAKLAREDVQVVSASEAKQLEMYQQGKADAFITFDPFKSQLAAQGAHVIFDSSQIPDEIFDLMVVHEDVFLARRKEVCEVGRQWYRTLDYMKQSPDEAGERIAKRLGVTVMEYHAMVKGISIPDKLDSLRLLSGNSPAIATPAANLVQVMLKEHQLKHSVDIKVALDANLEDCLSK
jgi:NitT/TauT family transport system substrate-binding protein